MYEGRESEAPEVPVDVNPTEGAEVIPEVRPASDMPNVLPGLLPEVFVKLRLTLGVKTTPADV